MHAVYCRQIITKKNLIMKKLIALIAIVAFLGGMSAPVLASVNSSAVAIELADKDPKKAEKKSSDCPTEKKAEKKSSDCTTEKKAPCEKTCGEKK
jgi:hypothetical protein